MQEGERVMNKSSAKKLIGTAMLGAVMITTVGCYPYGWRYHDYDRRNDYNRSDRYDSYDSRRDNGRWDRDRYR